MSKDARAQAVTILLILGVLGFVAWNQGAFEGLGRESGGDAGIFSFSRPRPAEPRDIIYAMLDAARDGVVDDYLDCYSGQIERTLRQSLDEMGPERFSNFLKERNRDIKGIAMNAPREAGEEAEVRVEYVYADRNEVQEVYLSKVGGDWKIARVSEIRRVETPVPYGTPVY